MLVEGGESQVEDRVERESGSEAQGGSQGLEGGEEREQVIPEDRIAQMYKVILDAGPQGLTQSEAWKALNLTSREGSRLAIRLERRGLIKRERVVRDGRWTYLLVPLVQPLRFVSVEEAPCLTCKYEPRCRPGSEINPINCPPDLYGKGIAAWVLREWEKKVRQASDVASLR